MTPKNPPLPKMLCQFFPKKQVEAYWSEIYQRHGRDVSPLELDLYEMICKKKLLMHTLMDDIKKRGATTTTKHRKGDVSNPSFVRMEKIDTELRQLYKDLNKAKKERIEDDDNEVAARPRRKRVSSRKRKVSKARK